MTVVYLTIYSLCTVCALAFGAAAAWTDIRGMKIPNAYSLFIAVGFFAAFICAQQAGIVVFGPLKDHVIAGVIVFGVTVAMYLTRTLGAGDSKLVSAFALWAGLQGLLNFILYTAVFGGVLGIVALVIMRAKPFKEPAPDSWVARLQGGERVVPYGVAIFLGAVTVFMALGYHAPDMLGALSAEE